MQTPAMYRFAGFELDTLRRRLTGPDGRALPLSSRGYDTLLYLVENRARVVDKEELIKAVWPSSVVEENNLSQAIYSARRALGESGDDPRFIRTVAGRGYRFIGELEADLADQPKAAAKPDGPVGNDEPQVEEPPERAALTATAPGEATPAIGRRRLLLALGAGAAAIAAATLGWRCFSGRRAVPRSLAVLPFRPLTDDSGDAAIEIGVSDLLINRLITLQELSVTPLGSVLRFAREKPTDPLEAGRLLGVEAVLDGSVQIRDQRIRLSARLTDTRSGRTLWAGDFTERLDDFFSAPVARDPEFALALAGLSEAHAPTVAFDFEPPVRAFEAARHAAARAIAGDSSAGLGMTGILSGGPCRFARDAGLEAVAES